MTFEVETGSRKRVVQITGGAGKYQAVVDGSAYVLDVARAGENWSLLIGPVRAGSPASLSVRAGRSYEVTVGVQLGGELSVFVNRRALAVRLDALSTDLDRRRIARRAGGRGDHTADTRSGPLDVTAPMPGRIVRVLVKAGDVVAARQGVVVVEAMKMENELRSPRAGTVKEVRVGQGALVEAKTVLVVIE